MQIKNPIGEVDGLVWGNMDALKELKKLCPFNKPVTAFADEANEHILICEAKTSYKEAINKMTRKNPQD